jgi:hypothetical protein
MNREPLPRPIPLEEGWHEIKVMVSLSLYLCSTHLVTKLSYFLFCMILFVQGIDKLEAFLNGGLRSISTTGADGITAPTSSMFGPKEYVAIYTYVRMLWWFRFVRRFN